MMMDLMIVRYHVLIQTKNIKLIEEIIGIKKSSLKRLHYYYYISFRSNIWFFFFFFFSALIFICNPLTYNKLLTSFIHKIKFGLGTLYWFFLALSCCLYFKIATFWEFLSWVILYNLYFLVTNLSPLYFSLFCSYSHFYLCCFQESKYYYS